MNRATRRAALTWRVFCLDFVKKKLSTELFQAEYLKQMRDKIKTVGVDLPQSMRERSDSFASVDSSRPFRSI